MAWAGYKARSLAQPRRRTVQHELPLQRQIWEFLMWHDSSACLWLDYQPLIPRGQRSWQHHSSVGVADIVGIWRGEPLAVEVKYGKNKTTPKQEDFLERFRVAGGRAFVAHSIDDVCKELDLSRVRFK